MSKKKKMKKMSKMVNQMNKNKMLRMENKKIVNMNIIKMKTAKVKYHNKMPINKKINLMKVNNHQQQEVEILMMVKNSKEERQEVFLWKEMLKSNVTFQEASILQQNLKIYLKNL